MRICQQPFRNVQTRGYGRVLALDENGRVWFEPRTGGRLVFSTRIAWDSRQPLPAVGDEIAFHQIGDRIVGAKRVNRHATT
jgi:hypothetical protein